MRPNPSLFQRPARGLVPAAGRESPRIWVRRLVIWDSKEEAPRRTVTLRRGVNIVWSPERKGGSADLGHGAGKTLLCRLIRYALGEAAFANNDVRDRVRSKLHNGRVGAEVVIGQQTWSVLRPLGDAGLDLASSTITVEQLVAGGVNEGWDAYLDALQAAVVTPAQLELLPDRNGHNPWLYALACCSRDQESRASGILNWRHQDSDAHSPVRDRDASEGTRLQALRVFLGALSADERHIRDDRARNGTQRAADERRAVGLEFGIEHDRAEIAAALGVALSEVRVDVVGREQIKARVRDILRDWGPDDSDTDPELLGWMARRGELAGEQAVLSVQVETTGKHLALQDALCTQLKEALVRGGAAVLDSQFPVCPVTQTPIDRVKAEGCPIAALPDEGEARRRRDELRKELAKAKQEFDDMETRHLGQVDRLAKVDAERNSLTERIGDRRSAHEAARQQRKGAWGVSALVDRFVRRQLELETLRAGILGSKAKDELAAESLEAARDRQRATLAIIETWFNQVINQLVGGESEGTLRLDGHGLHANVLADGDRSTVAINALKVAAFDIAVMAASVGGRGSLPGFLMQDSPREADLSVDIYERLFLLVRSLEGEVAGSAPFQYIITTTTPPPKRLQQEPWLVAELSGLDPENRLLRRSL